MRLHDGSFESTEGLSAAGGGSCEDGFLAVSTGPARAVTCAAHTAALSDRDPDSCCARTKLARSRWSGDAVRGLAVHVVVRVMAALRGGVLRSSTVEDRDRSGIQFEDRGTHEPKDVPGEWRSLNRIAAPEPTARVDGDKEMLRPSAREHIANFRGQSLAEQSE